SAREHWRNRRPGRRCRRETRSRQRRRILPPYAGCASRSRRPRQDPRSGRAGAGSCRARPPRRFPRLRRRCARSASRSRLRWRRARFGPHRSAAQGLRARRRMTRWSQTARAASPAAGWQTGCAAESVPPRASRRVRRPGPRRGRSRGETGKSCLRSARTARRRRRRPALRPRRLRSWQRTAPPATPTTPQVRHSPRLQPRARRRRASAQVRRGATRFAAIWRYANPMPRLAANVSTLFTEIGFLERFAAARKAGFRAVEYQYPYEFKPAEVARAAREAGVEVVLHNVPRGDPERREHGTACIPGREPQFREDLERAIEYARAVSCPRLHCLAGVVPAGAERRELHATYLANLKHAAARLKREEMMLLIEPVSERTAKNYFLGGSAQALAVLDELGADNAFLQYDFFHMQILEGNLAEKAER